MFIRVIILALASLSALWFSECSCLAAAFFLQTKLRSLLSFIEKRMIILTPRTGGGPQQGRMPHAPVLPLGLLTFLGLPLKSGAKRVSGKKTSPWASA